MESLELLHIYHIYITFGKDTNTKRKNQEQKNKNKSFRLLFKIKNLNLNGIYLISSNCLGPTNKK